MNQQHIATAKQLIRQKGRCDNIDCSKCPFTYNHCGNANILRTNFDEKLANQANEYLGENKNPRSPKFQTYQDSKDLWRWRLIAANGKIVAQGESHPTKSAAQRAVRTVKRIVKEM